MPEQFTIQNHSDEVNYTSPPIVETVVGVQFDEIIGFKNAHLGAYWKSLDHNEWPTVNDLPPIPVQKEQFADDSRWGQGLQLQLTQNPSSRLQIQNCDSSQMLQVQNNRFHLNWIEKGNVPYPRYERVSSDFRAHLQSFHALLKSYDLLPLKPNQWEVTYVNVIKIGTVWNSPLDWGFFRPLRPMPSLEGIIEAESLTGEWHFQIPGSKGRLHIQWQHSFLPQSSTALDEEVIRLTFTARGPIEKSGDDTEDCFSETIFRGLDLGHQTIVKSFRGLMSDQANTTWGLK